MTLLHSFNNFYVENRWVGPGSSPKKFVMKIQFYDNKMMPDEKDESFRRILV